MQATGIHHGVFSTTSVDFESWVDPDVSVDPVGHMDENRVVMAGVEVKVEARVNVAEVVGVEVAEVAEVVGVEVAEVVGVEVASRSSGRQ